MKANTCLVVDVWEGQLEIDEVVLKANGVAGMAIRLNDITGGHHLDTGFKKQWAEALNFVRFPYFVYNPWVDGTTNYAWLAANIPAEAHSVAVDIEVRKTGYPTTTYAAEVAKFLQLCQPHWKTIIYTAQWFLPDLSVWPRLDYWWAQYPDSATYFKDVKTWDDLKVHLDALDKPFNQASIPGSLKMWQFSGDYLVLPGNSRAIDVNIFYGTQQDLAAYFGSGLTPTPPPVSPYKAGLYSFSPVNYFARPGGGPLTLSMSRQRKLGDNLTRLNWAVLKPALTRLNASNLAAVDMIAKPDWGASKGLDGNIIKWLGLLWPGRNVVKIEEVQPGDLGAPDWWGRVEGVPLAKAGSLSAYDNPDVVQMVYDYNKSNGYGERAKPVFVPILDGSWWVDMSKLAGLDSLLPKVVKVRANPTLNVRSGPGLDMVVIGARKYGDSLILDQVKIGKGGLWGRISGSSPENWVALRSSGTNWTDWLI